MSIAILAGNNLNFTRCIGQGQTTSPFRSQPLGVRNLKSPAMAISGPRQSPSLGNGRSQISTDLHINFCRSLLIFRLTEGFVVD